jgi:NAD(P)-dependent dehydrogenase (short-subunit alcohol dehydrogenase family)
MDLNLKNKVAWVAGATGTLGYAIAQSFAREGAKVAVSSRRTDAVARVATELDPSGRSALGIPVDVTDEAAVRAAADRIQDHFGRIDVLVTSMNSPAYGSFLELDKATFMATVNAKYLGYVACMQAALRHMVAQKAGAIVCITGTGGKMPIAIHMPGGSVNAALNLIVRGLANQFGKDGVRLNAVSPGRIRSPRQDQMLTAGAAADNPAKEFPLGRFGEPQEVADAVLFLASERASYITGHVLNVDGGSVMTL